MNILAGIGGALQGAAQGIDTAKQFNEEQKLNVLRRMLMGMSVYGAGGRVLPGQGVGQPADDATSLPPDVNSGGGPSAPSPEKVAALRAAFGAASAQSAGASAMGGPGGMYGSPVGAAPSGPISGVGSVGGDAGSAGTGGMIAPPDAGMSLNRDASGPYDTHYLPSAVPVDAPGGGNTVQGMSRPGPATHPAVRAIQAAAAQIPTRPTNSGDVIRMGRMYRALQAASSGEDLFGNPAATPLGGGTNDPGLPPPLGTASRPGERPVTVTAGRAPDTSVSAPLGSKSYPGNRPMAGPSSPASRAYAAAAAGGGQPGVATGGAGAAAAQRAAEIERSNGTGSGLSPAVTALATIPRTPGDDLIPGFENTNYRIDPTMTQGAMGLREALLRAEETNALWGGRNSTNLARTALTTTAAGDRTDETVGGRQLTTEERIQALEDAIGARGAQARLTKQTPPGINPNGGGRNGAPAPGSPADAEKWITKRVGILTTPQKGRYGAVTPGLDPTAALGQATNEYHALVAQATGKTAPSPTKGYAAYFGRTVNINGQTATVGQKTIDAANDPSNPNHAQARQLLDSQFGGSH